MGGRVLVKRQSSSRKGRARNSSSRDEERKGCYDEANRKDDGEKLDVSRDHGKRLQWPERARWRPACLLHAARSGSPRTRRPVLARHPYNRAWDGPGFGEPGRPPHGPCVCVRLRLIRQARNPQPATHIPHSATRNRCSAADRPLPYTVGSTPPSTTSRAGGPLCFVRPLDHTASVSVLCVYQPSSVASSRHRQCRSHVSQPASERSRRPMPRCHDNSPTPDFPAPHRPGDNAR
jgi:hypothetical protein